MISTTGSIGISLSSLSNKKMVEELFDDAVFGQNFHETHYNDSENTVWRKRAGGDFRSHVSASEELFYLVNAIFPNTIVYLRYTENDTVNARSRLVNMTMSMKDDGNFKWDSHTVNISGTKPMIHTISDDKSMEFEMGDPDMNIVLPVLYRSILYDHTKELQLRIWDIIRKNWNNASDSALLDALLNDYKPMLDMLGYTCSGGEQRKFDDFRRMINNSSK